MAIIWTVVFKNGSYKVFSGPPDPKPCLTHLETLNVDREAIAALVRGDHASRIVYP